jgi:pilus assembly protein CpaB
MFLRRFLLALGIVALLAGVTLTAVWFTRGPSTTAETAQVAQQTVLVAARPIAAGSLLRAEDIRWKRVAAATVAEGTILQGQAAESDLFGAVARRDFAPGEALIAGQIIKPTESGFLAAVLAPGSRAVSIEVGTAESESGLISPGDYVDILLTQNFDDQAIARASKSVSETVLQNLRVVAVGQTISAAERPAPGQTRVGVSEARVPKTVTLEVSENQAETLMVAMQIGKVQLALRSLEKPAQPQLGLPNTDSTWASDVSPALRIRTAAPSAPVAAPAKAGERTVLVKVIEIMRGSKVERRCFSSSGDPQTDCGPAPIAAP